MVPIDEADDRAAIQRELRALLGGPSNDLHRSIEKRDVAQLQSSLGEGLGDLCERDRQPQAGQPQC